MLVLRAEDFLNFLVQLKCPPNSYDIILPFHSDKDRTFLGEIDSNDKKNIDLTSYRSVTPIKFLFYFPREKVYPVTASFPKRILAGVKACDLKALELLDDALLKGDFVEPVYAKWRDATTIISSDCREICSSCSCNLFDGKPFPEHGFDLNISSLNGNYLVKVGSEKGEKLVKMFQYDYREAVPSDNDDLKKYRQTVYSNLKEQNNKFSYNWKADLRETDKSSWEDKSKECIGCGACTNICPTCYCLILNDESVKEKFIKMRNYDSCQWHGYARVAGGGTPRPHMHQRFRNRYLCKLDFMQSNFKKPGCTGCGRCTEACAAGIDFRETLTELSKSHHEEQLLV